MGRTLLRLILFSFLMVAGGMPAYSDEPKELRILRITPEGEDVTAMRQIVLEFNRPVVPIGAMERMAEEVGITITPALDCQWRWLNTTTLSCNLSDQAAMVDSTKYAVHVEPVIKAEDGAGIATAQDHTFTTQRPRTIEAYVTTWKAPGTPYFRLRFNQNVTKSSAASHIYFEDLNSKERHAVSVVTDEEDTAKPVMVGDEEARMTWYVSPQKELPLATQFILKQEAGLVSATGPEAGGDVSDIKTFYTFPEFYVRGLTCRSIEGGDILITPTSDKIPESACDPLSVISLSFSTPVFRSQLKEHLAITPELGGGNPDANPWGEIGQEYSRLYDDCSQLDAEYRINLPYGLKAAQDYVVAAGDAKPGLWARIVAFFKGQDAVAQSAIIDEFGRTLPSFNLSFATSHRKPNYELVYRHVVLEKGVNSDMPLYVNNLKNFSIDYHKMDTEGSADAISSATALPDVEDVQFAVPVGIRELLGNKSGALFGLLQTQPAVEKWEGANKLFVQVTPFQVYAKLGHFKSTVWVTDLTTGAPVEGATVTVYNAPMTVMAPSGDQAIAAIVTTDANGVATFAGLSELDPDLSLMQSWKDEDDRLMVLVHKGDDMGLLPITYEYGVQMWDVATDIYANNEKKYGHMKAWGMTAQGIYRAGDTMQYKIYVRDQDNERFIAPSDGKYALEITDPTGKSVEKIEDVKLNDFGTLSGDYKIAETAPVGWYQFKLIATFKIEGADTVREFYPLSVLVSDFTPAPFRVTTELNGDAFKVGDKLDINADAKLHSGGAYGSAAIRSTITLKSRPFTSKDPKAQGFTFDSFTDELDSEDIFQKEDKLDDKGEWKTSFTIPEKKILFGQLVVESAVRDDRGKSIANAARADYAGVDRLVGLKPTEWVFEAKKPAIVQTLVVDSAGKPVLGVPVVLTVEKEEVVTAKVKSAGNAYTSDNTVEWKKTANCAVTSSSEEAKDCSFTPDSAGTYRITAVIKDTKGHEHSSQQTLWVSGDDYVQWNEGKENMLTILPEKSEYKVGDTARFLIKNPFAGAHALITVERLGVLDSYVQKLEGSAPVIEVPVKPDYVPGFYLSVSVISPRVDAPSPELGQVDMGKPAFRVGYVKMDVSDPYKEMEVTAKAEAEVYRPRDTIKVELEAKPANAMDTKEPIELAVVVLDESVFDLIGAGEKAYDPFSGFYELDSLDVANYSLLTRLMGRQNFEKKGANAGGDGGVDAGMRNLFKFVSYWNPSVPIGEDGKAHIEFEAPDNLTGWKILAIATTPNDRMGLGTAEFKVNRPTEIRPAMPNQVREGDSFNAAFTVMNRTDAKRDIKVTINANGDVKAATKEETVSLEPYKRATITMPLQTPFLPMDRNHPEGKISFNVAAGDAEDSDGMEHILPVLKSRVLEVAANYASTTDEKVSESIAVPDDIFTDTGEVSVALSPSVIASLDGTFNFMRDYPYFCWEQRISKAVMASHFNNLKPYLDEKTKWDDTDMLPQLTLEMAASFQAPNGGMAYYTAEDQYVDPYLSAYTAMAFRWLKQAGYKVPVNIETNLHKYLLEFLRKDAAPDFYQDGMKATVRAVILAALKDTGKLTKDDVLRFKDHVKNMNLFGKTHYMTAAASFPETQKAARDTLGMILSSGNESGGKFSFKDTYDDGWERILATPLRDNCAAVSALIAYDDKEMVAEKPMKLVRMITQTRENRDHFENTQENLFCMQALIDYAKMYENEEPDMKVSTAFGVKSFGDVMFADVKDKPVTLMKPLEEGDAGKKATLNLTKEGSGRLYYNTRLTYAKKNPKDSVNAGMDIRREYSIKKNGKWELAKSPVSIKRGDLVKVDLYLSLLSARNFVVVNDPLPGGLETVNRDLETASTVDANQGLFDESGGSYWFKFTDWKEYAVARWSFYHKELRYDSARFYSDYLTPGNYHLSYLAQAVATGTFAAPPTRAEEMYDADVFGMGAKGELVVKEAP